MTKKIGARIHKLEALFCSVLAGALFGIWPQSLFAVDGSEQVTGGGVIEFTGAAEVSRVGAGELLLKFTNTVTAGSVKLPGLTQMRILAVGGGGGGGGSPSGGFSGDYGACGGGGGGGVVEVTNMFDKAEYTIIVGAGGAAGSVTSTESKWKGENGDNTTLAQDNVVFLTAYGGGGGGGQGPGLDGASGGGGSQSPTSTYRGGTNLIAAVGQGFAGGAGDEPLYGGGGGGAGGKGEDAKTRNPVGGKGRLSTIADIPGDYYGGGGGGSYGDSSYTATGSFIAGGSGGGGNGGYGKNVRATAGEDGRGGGGGGCNAGRVSTKAGKGGSGVVYLRISASMAGDLQKPVDQFIPYDGESHAVVTPTPFYTIRGDLQGKEVGAYSARVSLNRVEFPDLKWSDGTTDDVAVMLAITEDTLLSGTEVVHGGGKVAYAGASSVEWIDNEETGAQDLLLVFTNATSEGAFKFSGKTKARILAIGGGGGGGGSTTSVKTPNGGGGGGGAGGVIEITNFLDTAVFAVKVGEGGAAGTITSSSSKWLGENGLPTTVKQDGEAFLTAYGGGGGGGHGRGGDGASGGGGSRSATATFSGGTNLVAAAGQGCDGGAGDEPLYGGGGGGAGVGDEGKGKDALTKNPTGGKGRFSDITGTPDYYGGGGGGGCVDSTLTDTDKYIAGGEGGGGNGGYGKNVRATAGVDGKGGGGGGCNAGRTSTKAGVGGCGGVYVRISMSFEGDIPKPEPVQSYVYDGNAHTSVVESLAYEIDGPVVGTDVGDYEATVTLMEGLSWKGGGEREQPVVMHITKAKATISDLVQKDWMFGTPAAAVPKPKFKVNLPGVTATYGYGEAEAGPFQPFPPTAIGTHWVQVKVEGTANYDGDAKATSFAITKGMGDVFMDYVEITIDGYTGTDPSVLVNFPYKVVLSEKAPNGFLYSRAGTTGHGLTFTDLAGNILPYDIGKWDVDGESCLYVKMPQIGSESQTIRLYWAVRPTAAAPGHRAEEVWNDWSKEEAAKVSSPASAFDFVSRNGYRINYWKVPPEMTKTVWDERDPEPGAVRTEGELAYGTPVRRFVNAFDETVVYDAMPTTGGAYRVVWEYKDPEGEFEDFRDAIDFTIFGHNPIDVFGDPVQATLSGRVMLVNDDIAEGHGVDYQSYWHVRETDGKLNDIFWEHTGVHDCWDSYIHNIPGISHALYHIADDGATTNLLWRFENVLIGNTFKKGSPLSNHSGKCFLPWSSTACSFSEPGKDPGLMEESCNIVMRNMVGAAVYSPVYSNGVGTIYFDAVNANLQNVLDGVYRLRVDIAVADSAEELKDIAEDQWQTISMLPLKRDETDYFVACPETEHLSLDITHDKSTNNFYRVCAKVDRRGPVCFRIVRESSNPQYAEDLDLFILLDNIVVSYPKNGAELKPYGKAYDRSRKGKQILGQEAAMTVPFPAAGGVGVRGRGRVSTYANPLNTVDPDTFVSYAKMWYRWRYLDQASNAWDSVELWPANGFVSKTALKLPAKEGDLEFFYELHTQVPYFRYYDYSGLGVGIDESLYTEDTSVVTNAMPAAERLGKVLPSGGTNWFVRLRAGRSDYEGWRLWVKADDESEPVPYDMELVSDRTWRGYFPTPKPREGEEPVRNVKVRVEALNRQEPGEVMFFENTAYFKFDGAGAIVPWATTTLVAGEGADDWSEVACDGSTGYLLVQLEEQTRGVSVVHADYQDFNKWSDANRKDGQGLFVGTSTDTNSLHMSGSGAKTREFDGNVGTWHLSCPTSQYWSESFVVPEEEMAPGGNWETYKEFKPGQRAPNGADSGVGFTVGRGMWVTGNYRDTKTGMAYQMAGKGEGYLQFMNAVSAPRGIESVSFSARLGQGIGFDDFAYADLGDKPNMTNYTFLTRGAFDLASRSQFSGNASLSVVAGYRAGEGCYEFRVEQQGATFETAASTKVKAAGNTFRISLHRWRYDPSVGDVVSTELGFRENVTGTDILNTSGEGGKFTALYISLEVRADGTRVSAGMTSSTSSVGNYNSVRTFAHALWINDTSADRLDVGGTYGVLTANCPGRFVQPVAYAKATSVSGTWPTAKADYKSISVPPQTENSCRDAIDKGGWAIPRWRMTKYVDTGAGKAAYYGLDATVFAQELEVYTAPVNTDQWTLLTNATISTYGAPGDAGRMTFDVWSKDDCAIRISSGTSGKSERNGIVIDDVVIRQWRGESYNDPEGTTYFKETIYGSPTNVVFTQAWIAENEFGVTNCQLVAKRSQADVATSVRSPLMDGQSGRGIGLGMFSFTYANAQTNANLLLQVSTNGLSETYLATETKAAESSYWTTVTNYSFAALTDAERKSGSRAYYFGYHGVKGAMRLIVDPALVKAVENERDPNKFGSIDITGVLCRDEPKLDEASWWGWNIRTTDEADKASLCDRAEDPEWNGLSFGLNNSVVDGIRTNDVAQAPLYPEHLPFLQTPTFVNETVGQVVFKARKYVGDAPARLTLYGAKRGIAESGTDAEWTPLASWSVTNDLFETYSHKTQAGDNYTAFRFAVTGVDGVKTPTLPQTKFPTTPCARVLVDEVLVMEAVRATVAFRNVAAFRTGLEETRPIMNITDRAQQPLCNEDWGVQAEVYAAQLADEVDLTSARVRLWWHVGVSPWGFDRWKDDAEAKGDCAWLAPCEGTNLVFRSSYVAAKEAVMRAQPRSETVQFMLEVVYDNKDGSEGRSWLTADDWKTPSWYAPLDYNADYGGSREDRFSAYTIIDSVSPGWAWINEVNVYGGFDDYGNNLDKTTQFVEIAAPYEANLENWTLRFLDAGVNTGRVITNDVAVFGSPTAKTLPGRKEKPGMDPDSKFVFHVIASPKVVTFSEADGELDGRWKIQKTNSAVDSGGIVNTSYPLAIQLVRPSGIVEHELVAIGTNEWAVADSYNPDKHRDFLNAHERGARFFCAPMDCQGFAPGAERSRSAGVFADNGASFMQWNNANTMTPGRLNEGQVINPDYPKPLGTALMIYSVVDGPHLNQTFADLTRTNTIATLIFRKGDENGTNITYHVDPWYELGSVTTNGVPVELPSPNGHDYVLNVGRNASNDLTVVARAAVSGELVEKYGLGPNEPYRDAIMDWLSKGRTRYGEFSGPNKGLEKIGLGEFHSLKFDFVTNLTLRAMYWLDMDPTWNDGDLWLMAGTSDIDPTTIAPDIRLRVKMVITNTSDRAEAGLGPGLKYWKPYILQSAAPGVSSWEYADTAASWAWSNVTFKVTGIFRNGLTDLRNRKQWVPLRWFVFGPDSFDDNFEAEIDIVDPYSTESPGFNAGWYRWIQDHPGEPKPAVWHAWDIDDRLKPVSVEVLKPTNKAR